MPWGDCTGPWWSKNGNSRGPRRGGGYGRGFGFFRGWFGGPFWAQNNYNNPDYYSEDDEKSFLKTQESWLKSRLEAIRQRLRDLGERDE